MKETLPTNLNISHYRIISKLGAGGMGEVYLAEDVKLNRKAAIKLLPAHAVESEAETEALLSEPGAILGTVPYMSPEQVRGLSLDSRSDIFSFGVVLYEMLTGRQPFRSESTAATASAILTVDPQPLARFLR